MFDQEVSCTSARGMSYELHFVTANSFAMPYHALHSRWMNWCLRDWAAAGNSLLWCDINLCAAPLVECTKRNWEIEHWYTIVIILFVVSALIYCGSWGIAIKAQWLCEKMKLQSHFQLFACLEQIPQSTVLMWFKNNVIFAFLCFFPSVLWSNRTRRELQRPKASLLSLLLSLMAYTYGKWLS